MPRARRPRTPALHQIDTRSRPRGRSRCRPSRESQLWVWERTLVCPAAVAALISGVSSSFPGDRRHSPATAMADRGRCRAAPAARPVLAVGVAQATAVPTSSRPERRLDGAAQLLRPAWARPIDYHLVHGGGHREPSVRYGYGSPLSGRQNRDLDTADVEWRLFARSRR